MLENRGTMARRKRSVEASVASGTVGSSPEQTLFLPQKSGWTPKGVFSLSIVHYPLSIVHYSLSITKNSLNFEPTRRHFCARNLQKPAKMIPMMTSFVPVQYRFSTGYDRLSTGKVPVTVGYGRLRSVRGNFRLNNQPLSTKANPVLH
jgi:hypothetical protein